MEVDAVLAHSAEAEGHGVGDEVHLVAHPSQGQTQLRGHDAATTDPTVEKDEDVHGSSLWPSDGWPPRETGHRATEGELVLSLRQEQDRLGLRGSAQLLAGTIHRRLHKVGAVIYPGERDRAMMHLLFELYHNPEKRRAKEIELCEHFGRQLGRTFEGHEILIDIPALAKSPEVDLKVFYGRDLPSEKPDPLSFADPEVSRLRDSLLLNFEDQAKIFRIFCIPDPQLRALVRNQVKRQLN